MLEAGLRKVQGHTLNKSHSYCTAGLANSGPTFIVKREEENQTESCFTVYSTRKKTEERVSSN